MAGNSLKLSNLLMLCLWNLATLNYQSFPHQNLMWHTIIKISLLNFYTVAMVLKETRPKELNTETIITVWHQLNCHPKMRIASYNFCVDKKANKLNTNWKNIHIIRTMAALEMMITLHPRVVVKSGWENKRIMKQWLGYAVWLRRHQNIV